MLGFILLFGIGKEYAQASRDLGTFVSPGIIIAVILFLLLCTWLIGSGFSKRKLKFKSFEFLKFFIITFIGFASISFFSLILTVVPSNFVEINGIKVPLSKCMDGSKGMIPNKNESEKYCLCLTKKITSDSSLVNKYQSELESGRIDDILIELQNTDIFVELDLESCFNVVEIEWTNNLTESMKENLKMELNGSEFEKTNNIEKYCDCLINEYKKYPLNKVIEDGFNESEIGIFIDSLCIEKSKKITK